MYIESGLNFISVGLLLDLEDYLTERHKYIVCDGVIYEKLGKTERVISHLNSKGCGYAESNRNK